jgi:hypothetical protein
MRGSKVTGKGELRLPRPISRKLITVRYESPNGTVYDTYRSLLDAELAVKEHLKSSEKHPVYLTIG